MRWLLTKTLRILAQGSRADARERAVLIRQIKATIENDLDRNDHDDNLEVGF